MNEDKIKEAFAKVKEDISGLKSQTREIVQEIQELKRTLIQTDIPTHPTDRQIIPTHPQEVEGLKPQNLQVSIGNEGVPTDRQTNQQTDKTSKKFVLIDKEQLVKEDKISQIDKVSEMLNSLDAIRKEIRAKFKKLTPQEMLVFSIIYQLEDQGFSPDYRIIANKTNLSESSIRDYTLKLIAKGVPVDKIKQNNKKITLSIPQSLRRITSLGTILKLREI